MYKFILKYLKRRKWDVGIIIIATSLLSVVTLFALLIATDICTTKKKNAIETYGSFICGGSTKNKNKLSDITTQDKVIVGSCDMLGKTVEKGIELPVGIPDSNFLKLSSCKIIEGRLPQKKNEIAIEKYLINLFDNAKIGSSIEIKINNKVDKYVITGYVRNYSMTLNVNIDKPNEDCYPVIILGSENRTKQKYTSFLAGWRNASDIGYDEEKEIDKIRNELKNENIIQITNDNLFAEGFEYCREIQAIAIGFSLIIFVLSIIVCINVYKVLYKNIRKDSGILATLGATAKQRNNIVIFQILCITFFSMLLSSGLISFTIMVYNTYMGSNNIWGLGNIICCIVCWYIVYGVFITIFVVKEYFIIQTSSIRNNLSDSRKSTLIKVKSNHNLLLKMSGANVVDVIKYLSVFIVVFVCVYLIVTLRVNFIETPDYELISQNVDVSEVVNGYEIKENIGKNYNIQQVDEILNKYSDAKIVLEPDMENTTLLIEKKCKNSFFTNWNQKHILEDTQVDESEIVANWPPDASKYQPLHDVDYLIISDEEYENISKQENIKKSKNGIILYLPSNDKWNSDDNNYIGFGGFGIGKTIKFEKNNLKIDGVIDKAAINTIDKNTVKYSDQLFDGETITVLINKSKAINNHIIQGYSKICIYLNNAIKGNSEINNDMGFLQSQVQGGTLYSKSDNENKARDYNIYIRNIGICLIIIVLVIAAVYSVCNVLFYIKMNRRKIGIMMILGNDKKTTLKIRLVSNLKSVLYAIMIALIIVVIFIYDGTNYLICIKISSISFICDIFLALIDCVLFYNFLKRVNIKKCIYN